MKIIYLGAGFVGACSAAVSADSGHEVLAFDIDAARIAALSSGDPARIRACLHEEGLAELILQHRDRLVFSAEGAVLAAALEEAQAVFLCLPTPESADGASDMSAYRKALAMLGGLLVARRGGTQENRILLINKSTVPIDTIDLARSILDGHGVKNCGLAANPEFLVEGQAVHDSIHPKRVVVGAETPEDLETLRGIYRRFYDAAEVTYLEMNPYEATAVKLLSNASLFTRLAFTFTVAGRLCEVVPHLDYEQIRTGVTSDTRIGSWGFYDSLYAGGSCLIKDALSLAHQIAEHGGTTGLLEQVLAGNDEQVTRFFARAAGEAGFDFSGKRIALLGLAFKQGTNDVRHSGSLRLARMLLDAGVASIEAFDPAANDTFRAALGDDGGRVNYHTSAAGALAGCQAAILATDWPEFRTLGETIRKHCPPPFLFMDGRRLCRHDYAALEAAGYALLAVGSPFRGKRFS